MAEWRVFRWQVRKSAGDPPQGVLERYEELTVFKDGPPTCMAYSPCGTCIVFVFDDGTIAFVKAGRPAEDWMLWYDDFYKWVEAEVGPPRELSAVSVAWSPDSNFLAIGTKYGVKLLAMWPLFGKLGLDVKGVKLEYQVDWTKLGIETSVLRRTGIETV